MEEQSNPVSDIPEQGRIEEMPPVEEPEQNIEISTEGSKEVEIKKEKVKKPPPPVITVDFIRSISPIALTKSEVDRSVFVRNISINATLKAVYDFFLFFGKIQKIFLHLDIREKLGKQIGIVVFEKKESFDTCLLLNNVVLVDQPIEVHSLRSCLKKKKRKPSRQRGGAEVTTGGKGKGTPKKVEEPTVRKSLSNFFSAGLFAGESVIRSMRNSVTYVDDRVRGTVKGVDESMGVTKTVKGLGEGAKKSIEKVDTTLGVTKRTKDFADSTTRGFNIAKLYTQVQINKIDEKLGVTKGAKYVGGAVTEKTKKGIDGLTSLGGKVKGRIVPGGLTSQGELDGIPVMLPTDLLSEEEQQKSGLPPLPNIEEVDEKKKSKLLLGEEAEQLQPPAPQTETTTDEVEDEEGGVSGLQNIPLDTPEKRKEERLGEKKTPVAAANAEGGEEKKEKDGEIDLLIFSPQNVAKKEEEDKKGGGGKDGKGGELLKFN